MKTTLEQRAEHRAYMRKICPLDYTTDNLLDDLEAAEAEIVRLKKEHRWFDQWLSVGGVEQVANLQAVYEQRKEEIRDLRMSIEASCDKTMSRQKHELRELRAELASLRAERVTDKQADAILAVDTNHIQGFKYGERYVIRDVLRKDGGELWWAKTGVNAHNEMLREIKRIKLRAALTAALNPKPDANVTEGGEG